MLCQSYVPLLIDLLPLLLIITLTVVKAQYFVENLLVCHPNNWLRNYVPNMSRRCIVSAEKLIRLLLILHVYYLPSMSLKFHRRFMLVTFPLTFDNLCRDHVGVLNAKSMAIKLKIVDLQFLYAQIVDRKVTQPLNPPRALMPPIVFTVVETMVQIHLTVQLTLSKKR